MVKCCYVPGCTTGNASYVRQQKANGLKNKSLFKPPKNKELLAKWNKAIPRKDKVLTESSYVCELHFEENDVLFYDETILWDGTVNKLKRIRPILRAGAVPCIFPNLPFYLTKHNKIRKPPRERSLCIDKKLSKPSQSHSDTGEMRCPENIYQEFSFQYLKENLNQLEKPDSKWIFKSKDDEVVLVRCNCGSSKKITISNSLIAKIFFSDVEVIFDNIINTVLSSMNDTNKLLKNIHSLIECKGMMTSENIITRSITCQGYVEKRLGQRGRMSNYCFDCRVARKKMADSLRKKLSKLGYEVQNI